MKSKSSSRWRTGFSTGNPKAYCITSKNRELYEKDNVYHTDNFIALSASSCQDKKEQNRTEQQIENAKENVNDALDKASNKIEDGADKVKDAWKETKKDVQQGTEKVKKEIKKDYNKAKDELKKQLD